MRMYPTSTPNRNTNKARSTRASAVPVDPKPFKLEISLNIPPPDFICGHIRFPNNKQHALSHPVSSSLRAAHSPLHLAGRSNKWSDPQTRVRSAETRQIQIKHQSGAQHERAASSRPRVDR
eukprot:2230296-Prymnesium_polylepis.2